MIFSAIGGAVAGLLFTAGTTAFAIASTIVTGALSFGARLAWSYVNRTKSRKYSAVSGEVELGASVPASTIYGIGKIVGHRVDYFKYGKGNRVNSEVFVLANGWCDGLEPAVFFYGEKHNLVPRPPIGNEIQRFAVETFGDLIDIRFYDGRPGQTADMKLVNATAALGRKWKETSRCTGLAYVVVDRIWDEEKLNKGRPTFEWLLRGLRLYDPRKDSTVAGGSGPHRRDNPATWQFSRNPALQRLNYQLGLRGRISNRTLIGEGKSLGQLDLSSYFAAMNVCDTLRIDDKPTYICSLVVNAEDDHKEILDEFDDAMAGYALNRSGLSGVIPGAPQIAVMDIGPDDLPIDRQGEIQYRKSSNDAINHLSGQFISPEANWSADSLKPIHVNADVAADGGRIRQKPNDFLQVPDADIAQYLLTIRYRQNRLGGAATLPVSRRVGLKVIEGNWVTHAGRTWLVTGRKIDPQVRVTLTLAETSAAIYDDEEIEPGPIGIPSTPPINPSMLSTVQNFNVEIGIMAGSEGFQVPALRFTWDPPEDPTITAVRFNYLAGLTPTGGPVFKDSCDDPEAGEYFTTKNVVSGNFYTANATISTTPDRFKTLTPWKTTAMPVGPLTVYLPGVVDEILERIEFVDDFAVVGAREAFERFRQLTADEAEGEAAGWLERQVIKSETAIQIGAARAYVGEAILLAVGPDGVVTGKLNELRSEFQGGLATVNQLISTEVTRIDGVLTSTANQISSLSAQVGNIESTFTMRAQAVASPGGGVSRWVVQVRSGSVGGNFISTSFLMEADSNGIGSAGFITDRFFLLNPANTSAKVAPFVFQAGIAYMENARIGDLIFNKLRSADGKMVLSGMGGTYIDVFA